MNTTVIQKVLILSFLSILLELGNSANLPCIKKDFGESSIVCVCNSTYCDTAEPLGDIEKNKFYHVVSSIHGQRFETTIEEFGSSSESKEQAQLFIERNLQYQTMIGFGGAFTDATGINMLKLSKELQDTIINAYFGKIGLEYTISRIPIGGTDFSDRAYSLNDLDSTQPDTDPELIYFSLQEDDFKYKIRYCKEAQKLQPDLKLFASPWSPPKWMKSNGEFTGFSSLLPEYYQSWANYFIRFLEEYDKNGIRFWGLTPQNEPIHGLLIPGGWNSMGWTAAQSKKFIQENLGPTLKASKFNNTKLIMMDDQRFSVVDWTNTILGDPESAQFVDGIGLHWYANFYTPPSPLNVAHENFPDYFMLNTEACAGYMPGVRDVILGSWERAELYAHNIIEDLNHWLSGWVEWNLVLDMTGGPNWASNEADAPIIIDATAGEAYKQPMYYALGHFSKYVTENSVRLSHSGKDLSSLEVLSVLRPDNKVVLVIFNGGNKAVPLRIQDTAEEGFILLDIGEHSIHTIVYSTTNNDTDSGSPRNLMSSRIFYISALIILTNTGLSLF